MFATLLETLLAGLQLWKDEKARQYTTETIKLRQEWYEEFNKDEASRSNLVLDNIEFRLRNIATAFASEARASNTGNKS